MKPRVYADTSVFGGFFDDEFAQHSIALVEQFRTGVILLIVSDLTLQELESAPQKVGDLHKSIPIELVEFVTLDDDAKFLASKYIEEKPFRKNTSWMPSTSRSLSQVGPMCWSVGISGIL